MKNNFINKFLNIFTFRKYYEMSFEEVRVEARKYGIPVYDYGDVVSNNDSRLDAIEQLIKKNTWKKYFKSIFDN